MKLDIAATARQIAAESLSGNLHTLLGCRLAAPLSDALCLTQAVDRFDVTP
jgi:hypothetical protein